ncbi:MULTISPECIES: FRG domain-containing protein [Providencia]|nr:MULTISPECIES: FRG domain-containing protein [Providencia]MBG5918366.1 FRG domain-containing protein [Providencia stuartii]
MQNSITEFYEDDTTDVIESVDTVSKFLEIVNDDNLLGNLYRGQRKHNWKIASSLTRAILPKKEIIAKILGVEKPNKSEISNFLSDKTVSKNIDIRIEKAFKSYVRFKLYLPQYIDEVTNKEYLLNSNLSLILLAQHYGLPTRFIDWSLNPLIALYFAVEKAKPTDTDAAVFIYSPEANLTGMEFEYAFENTYKIIEEKFVNDCSDFVSLGKFESFKFKFFSTMSFYDIHHMNELEKVLIKIKNENKNEIKIKDLDLNLKNYDELTISHYSFDKRMSGQECLFTYQDNIKSTFSPKNKKTIKKVIIKKPYAIKAELIKLGIIESRVYPSISGLANSLKFTHLNDNFDYKFKHKED